MQVDTQASNSNESSAHVKHKHPYDMQGIQPAIIDYKENGTPLSSTFDDVYFSAEDGIAESTYVFLEANQLWQRWQQVNDTVFTIAETGFGTGLNFLLTVKHFIDFRHKFPNAPLTSLHFISFEKHPIDVDALRQIQQTFIEREPSLAAISAALLARYPLLSPGCHRVLLPEFNTTLDVYFGDITQTIQQVESRHTGIVDAWYLDGFAPSKNTAMWADHVLLMLGVLAKPNATLATFTAAGFVKRGLQSAGFEIQKIKGFGRKRDMLTGVYHRFSPSDDNTNAPHDSQQRNHKLHTPIYYSRPATVPTGHLVIVGGGLASATLLARLAMQPRFTNRFSKITLVTKDAQLACGASSNRQGGFYPLLHNTYDPLSEFYSAAFVFAKRFYCALAEEETFAHAWCGVEELAHKPSLEDRLARLGQTSLWPDSLVNFQCAAQNSQQANITLEFDGVNFNEGGWIAPFELVEACIRFAQKRLPLCIDYSTDVTQLTPLYQTPEHQTSQSEASTAETSKWRLTLNDGNTIHADNVVLCTGYELNELLENNAQPIVPVRGQVSHYRDKANINEQSAMSQLATVLCASGYATPQSASFDTQCIGSTFVKGDQQSDIRVEETDKIHQMLLNDYAQSAWLPEREYVESSNAAIRATVSDHLPIVGQVPDHHAYRQHYANLWKHFPQWKHKHGGDFEGLFVFAGLGARGLCSAPLCADILLSQLLQHPFPVSTRVLNALHPNRFLIKQLKQPPKK